MHCVCVWRQQIYPHLGERGKNRVLIQAGWVYVDGTVKIKAFSHLLRSGCWCLIGVVVCDLVFQLVVRRQFQRRSLHLKLASAWVTGGEANGASTPAGGRHGRGIWSETKAQVGPTDMSSYIMGQEKNFNFYHQILSLFISHQSYKAVAATWLTAALNVIQILLYVR